MRLRRALYMIPVALVAVIGASVVFGSKTTYAVSGSCYFNTTAGAVSGTGTCSVPGYGGYGTNDILPGRSSSGTGAAIPATVNTKQEFINFVISRFNKPDAHNKVGAAFIMQTMLGRHSWPGADDIAEWKKRMNDSRVTVQRYSVSIHRTSWYDTGKNNTFYAPYSPGNRTAIVVKYKGNVHAVVETGCANLANDPITIPEASKNWSATPKTTVNKDQVLPAQVIRWKHTVTKSGPDNTSESIAWEIRQFRLNPGESKNDKLGSIVAQNSMGKGKTNGQILYKEEAYTATDADVGKRICQYIRIKPYAVVNDTVKNAWKPAEPQCTKVSNNIGATGNFVPSTEVDRDTAEPNAGERYTWKGQVTDGDIPRSTWRDGSREPQTTPSDVTFKVARYVYPAGVGTTYGGGEGSAFSCPSGSVDCNLNFRTGHAKKKPNGVTSFTGTEDVPGLAAGSRICYVASVYLPPETKDATYDYGYWKRIPAVRDEDGKIITPARRVWVPDVRHFDKYDQSTRKWRKSAEQCLLIAKRPRVQVWGSDVVVGGAIETDTSTYSGGMTYGSWGEYAVLSGGNNNFFGSGASYAGGATGGQASWSPLTFANTDSNDYGEFSLIPDGPPPIAAYYQARLSGSTPTLPASSTLSGKDGLYRASDVTLSGGNTNLTGNVIIYASGTVKINGPITYRDGAYGASSKLPQVIIIAKHIAIAASVDQVYAWLVTLSNPSDPSDTSTADDDINTCYNGPAQLTYNDCSTQLRINGPVITNNLRLLRTYGAKNETARGEPAEIFNLRPDAYLWAYQELGQSNSVAQTVDTTELPPRF